MGADGILAALRLHAAQPSQRIFRHKLEIGRRMIECPQTLQETERARERERHRERQKRKRTHRFQDADRLAAQPHRIEDVVVEDGLE